MKIFLFFLSFICFQVYAQDLNYLKSQDTVYIVLKDITANTTEKFDDFTLSCSGTDMWYEYSFINKDGFPVIIQTRNILNVPKLKENANITVNRKAFLKRNKDRIIDLEFIKKIVPETLFIYYLDVLYFKKKFYIINEDELKKKKRKIMLKKANIIAVGYAKS